MRVVRMSFKHTVLALEIENLHRRENEMYKLYGGLLDGTNNKEIKDKIRFLRDQELGHINMVTEIISILREHIAKG